MPWRPRRALPLGVLLSYLIQALAIIGLSILSYRSIVDGAENAAQTSQTTARLAQVVQVLSDLKDAETGQRGYLLVGQERYLEPFGTAQREIPSALAELRALFRDDPTQAERVDRLDKLVSEKVEELRGTIERFASGDEQGALEVVRSNRGASLMDRVRDLAAQIEDTERDRLQKSARARLESVGTASLITWSGMGLILLLIGTSAYTSGRSFRERDVQAWIRTGQAGLSRRLSGDLAASELADRAIRFLAEYLDAQLGTIHVLQLDGSYWRLGSFAVSSKQGSGEAIEIGEGLIGQAARERRILAISEVPEDYFAVSSSLGASKPRHLLVVPARVDGEVSAVIELAFFRSSGEAELELLERASETIATALRSAGYRARQAQLLEQSQRQAEELQESQLQLEANQRDLEEANAQLEEQTQALESQHEGLTSTRMVLEQQAAQLERTSRYKSEFLANMSHELRTPLNSLLILAKLLADNKEGNLSAEQISYAQNIGSAGSDLLTLINDILDLSKIEARKVVLNVEQVSVPRLVDDVRRRFEPLAAERGLELVLTLEERCPATIETDRQRLQQILTNLVSNAIKFTERGRVQLSVQKRDERHVAFLVEDTGLGIAPEHHEVIFEAFRQADGTTNRKFGGTGLGLSISRELAKLLGGEIELRSALGAGSTFSVLIPVTAVDAPAAASPLALPTRAASELPARPKPPPVDDDRDVPADSRRVVLVIEDDPAFAQILRDLGRELGYRCVLAASAAEGLRLARAHAPAAILLDIGLPDHSGTTVLEQLKRDPSTRHVPIHVVSVHDYQQVALEMGAAGYVLKPVQREQLVAAFRTLEERLARTVRRVLVVEDDARQRDALVKLLSAEGVELVPVCTAEGALAQLRSTTFDCCVLDLGLPGTSGFDLLDQMAQDETCSFPPVIVYTARGLSADEELRLRRRSRSIIVKGARSPERLLEEVTLFLHQVEATLAPEQRRMLRVVRDRDAALEGRRILVVEDDARNIFAISRLLEPKGALLEIARNGKEAIARLELQPAIELVLMDIMMPEMDGLTAMREIRARDVHRALPILALTSRAMPDDRLACLAAGASDYIAKPIDVEKLLSLLRVWLPG